MDDCHRIRDALLVDFDTTCQSVGAEIATSPDPIVLLDVILQLLVDDAKLIPNHIQDRLETEFVPQVVQILLGKPFDPQCIEQVNVFFQHILLKVAARLERFDPSLLATMVRLLDEHRQFYVYYGCEGEEPPIAPHDESSECRSQEFVTWSPYVSCYLLQNIDLWGKVGGFDVLVMVLEAKDPSTNPIVFEDIRNIFKCLFNIKDHLSIDFLKNYLACLTKATTTYVQRMSSEEFQSMSRESVNDFAGVIQLLLARLTSETQHEDASTTVWIQTVRHLIEMLQLETAFRFFQSCSLEKRINGLTDIIRLIHTSYESSTANVHSGTDESGSESIDKSQLCRIVDWIKGKNIINELLVGSKVHSELIKRSSPIFGFLCSMEDRQRTLVDNIWQSYTSGGSSRHEVLTSSMEQLIMELCALIDQEDLVHLVTLVQNSGGLDQFKESLLIKIVLRCLTNNTDESLSFAKQILLLLWKSLPDTSEERTEKLVSQMAEIVQHISLLAKDLQFVWECVDLSVRSIEGRTNVLLSLKFFTQLACLVTSGHLTTRPSRSSSLVDILQAELIDYATQDETNSTLVLVRLENIRTRLLAIRAAWMLTLPLEQKTMDLLNAVWSVCLSSHSTSEESSLFFQWLEICLNTTTCAANPSDQHTSVTTQMQHLLDQSLAEYLVVRKFPSLDREQMSMSMLSCFHQLFRRVNLLKGGLQCFSITSDDNDSENENDKDKSDQEVIDLVTGESKLIGLSELWQITIRSGDHRVAEEAMTLLTSCYIELVPTIGESKLPFQLKQEFISTCMHWLNVGVTRKLESQVNRCVDLLRYFLESTEQDDESGASHPTMPEMEELTLDILEEKLPFLDVYPSPIKEAGRLEPKGAVARRRSNNVTANEQDNDESTENETAGKLSLSLSVSASSESLLQSPVRSPASGRSRPHLDGPPMTIPQHGPDLSADDITLALHQVYSSSITGSPQLLSVSTLPSGVPNALWVSASLKKQSRFARIGQAIANHNEYFDTLFELVTWKEETSQRTWELLCRLPTNNTLLHQMICLREQKGRAVVWDSLLDVSSVHHLLYAIRLVEALLLPLENRSVRAEDSARRQWRERFVRLGGLQHLYKALMHWNLDGIHSSDSSQYSRNLHATCLAAILRIHNYFFQFCDHDTNQRHLNDSTFDMKFLKVSLPLCLEQMDLVALFNVSTKVMIGHCEIGSDTQLSSEAQEAVLGALCMCCRLGSFHPELLLSVDITTNEADSGLGTWLRIVLHDCPCATTRAKASDMLGQFVLCSGSRIVDFFLRSAIEILLISYSANCTQLFIFVGQLLQSVVVAESTIGWIETANVTERFLARLVSSSQCNNSNNNSSSSNNNKNNTDEALSITEWMDGCIDTLEHLCVLSSRCRNIIVDFSPSKFDGVAASGSWFVQFLVNHFYISSSPTGKSQTATVQRLLFELVFPKANEEISLATDLVAKIANFLNESLQILETTGRNWNFVVQSERKDKDGYVGLVNPGCICYMNALVQQLFMVPKFRDGLLDLDLSHSSSAQGQESACRTAREELEQLQNLFVGLRFSCRRAVDPTSFALSHRDMDGQPTDVRVQMDADEFFCLLLDRMDTLMQLDVQKQPQEPQSSDREQEQGQENHSTKLPSFVDDCFGGVLVNQIITEHGSISEREENFFALSLDVSSKEKLVDSLGLYVQGEILEGENAYYCEQACKKVNATKRICIKTLPDTLVLHLKRFEFDFDSMRKVKLNNFFEFPTELDMAPYTRESLSSSQTSQSLDDGFMSKWYDLVGVVVHSGTSETGHYYSFIKEQFQECDPKTKNDSRWFEFNDQVVRCFGEEMLGDECFGGEEIVQKWDPDAHGYTPILEMKRRSAYMLFYQAREREQTSDILPKTTKMTVSTKTKAVDEYKAAVFRENACLDKVLNSFGEKFADFIRKLVRSSFAVSSCSEQSEADTLPYRHYLSKCAIPTPTQFLDLISRSGSIASRTCVLVAQYLFGLMPLARLKDCSVSFTDVQEMTDSVVNWIQQSLASKNTIEAALFGMWFLRQFSQSSSHENAEVCLDGQRALIRHRTWLFDLLFLCDNSALKEAFFGIASECVTILLPMITSDDSGGNENQTQCTMNALESMLVLLTDLFFSREEMEVNLNGNPVSITAGIMADSYVQIAAFFEQCLALGITSNDAGLQKLLFHMFIEKSQFLNRFLTSLQADHRMPSDPTKMRFSSPLHQVRSCTLDAEKRILKLLFALAPESNWSQFFSSNERKLLAEIALVRNLFLYGFDRLVLHTFFVSCFATESRSYQEKSISTIMNVLEKLKDSHVDNVLAVFDAILDTGEELSIVEHVFSPTCGLLEAASYYQDNILCREYTSNLLQYIIGRGNKSITLQTFLQSTSVLNQVRWIGPWLVSHADRFEVQPSQHNDVNEKERTTPESDNCSIMERAKTVFGSDICKSCDEETKTGDPSSENQTEEQAIETKEEVQSVQDEISPEQITLQ